MNNKNKLKIREWLIETVKDGSWKNGNDLHIDEIDKVNNDKNKHLWIPNAINYFETARNIIETNKLSFVVELFIDLEYKEKNGDYTIKDIKDLEKELSPTPPSLYLFDKEYYIARKSTIKNATWKKLPNFLGVLGHVEIVYTQMVDEYGEIRRFMYLV